jgi:hypothetical protein
LDVLVAVLLAHFNDHDFQKLLEIYFGLVELDILFAVAEIPNEVADFLVAGVEAKGSEDNLEVFGLDDARARDIEEVESFFDLVFLGLSEDLLVV